MVTRDINEAVDVVKVSAYMNEAKLKPGLQ